MFAPAFQESGEFSNSQLYFFFDFGGKIQWFLLCICDGKKSKIGGTALFCISSFCLGPPSQKRINAH